MLVICGDSLCMCVFADAGASVVILSVCVCSADAGDSVVILSVCVCSADVVIMW